MTAGQLTGNNKKSFSKKLLKHSEQLFKLEKYYNMVRNNYKKSLKKYLENLFD